MPSTPTVPDVGERPRVVASGPARVAERQRFSGGRVQLARQPDGHFYADVQVNDSEVRFVVDTGASVVALSRADAEKAGVHVDETQFEEVARGASGPVMGTFVTIRELSLGDHRATDVQALVLADSSESLLGQDFLARFESVSIENDEMVLR